MFVKHHLSASSIKSKKIYIYIHICIYTCITVVDQMNHCNRNQRHWESCNVLLYSIIYPGKIKSVCTRTDTPLAAE